MNVHNTKPNTLTLLYTNIGRGHPFYLDGVIEMMNRMGTINLVHHATDVFSESSGISRLGWRTARYLYRQGSQNGLMGRVYRVIRRENDYNAGGLMLSVLGNSLQKNMAENPGQLLVAHPILVAILRDVCRVYYQHGELVTPKEAVVRGAEHIFVPTNNSSEPFLEAGYTEKQLLITGLCIEPGLVRMAEEMKKNRLQRINHREPLTGAFYSSGAEPEKHIQAMLLSIRSFTKMGNTAIVFCRADGKLSRSINRLLQEDQIASQIITAGDQIPHKPDKVTVVMFRNRREENLLTVKLFPYFDLLVSPAHERSNWAVGLGLPLYILEPCIGPFAPLNKELLLGHGVGYSLENDELQQNFGYLVHEHRTSGLLSEMVENGWGRYEIDGFRKIVNFFDNTLNKKSL